MKLNRLRPRVVGLTVLRCGVDRTAATHDTNRRTAPTKEHTMSRTIPTEILTAGIVTKRQAVAAVRDEANALIEQLERVAKGWDRGAYRADDTMRQTTIRERIRQSVECSFHLSAKFAEVTA